MNRLKHAFIVTALLAATALPSLGQMGRGPRLSPHEDVFMRLSGKLVTIYYGRPLSKKAGTDTVRTIWGGLVPWDKAWRLGADEATTLLNQVPIVIGGVTLPAGAYTLYMIPSETGTSKLAISKATGAWGIPVNEKEDVARVDLKKDDLPAQVDQLTLSLGRGAAPNTGLLKIMWEKTQYSIEFANAP